MNKIIKKIHTYTGLLTFVNLMVFGIAGLASTFHDNPEQRPPAVSRVIEQPFAADPNATDRQVAERVVAQLGLSLATPVHDFIIKHDAANNLWLDIYEVNGRRKVTFLEQKSRIRVEEYRNSIWRYLDNLHATTAAFKSGDWRMQLWANYNEFAMWCLLGMIVSGVYLWLSTRPGHRWAQVSLAAGASLFAVLWAITR